jgi:hypothetical protein
MHKKLWSVRSGELAINETPQKLTSDPSAFQLAGFFLLQANKYDFHQLFHSRTLHRMETCACS